MKLYDEVILQWDRLATGGPIHNLKAGGEKWPDVGNSNMVLRSDMAYELGGDTSNHLAALGGTAITDSRELVPEDAIVLVGPDLQEIKADSAYARLAVVRVCESEMGEGNTLYNAIRKIEFTKYHVNPKGFMVRVSSTHERESVRVSKEAVSEGITFEKVGNTMLAAFHENPKVEAVKLYFFTDPGLDYDTLEKSIHLAEGITQTVDHILKNAKMDCQTCSLQEICDEVEGLKELHFGTENDGE